MKNPIICAVDVNTKQNALSLINSLSDNVGAYKLGLEFFSSNGPDAVKDFTDKGLKIFLDLKFHDIPNTVAKAIEQICKLNCFMTTIHCLGGLDMMKAAKKASENYEYKPLIIGVTILTSHNQITELGIENKISDQVLKLTELAVKSGIDGVVCSPHEIGLIRKNFGNDLKLVVPGIRSASDNKNDQSRTLSAKEALSAGADYLVIGRPITAAENPPLAAKNILNSII
jgi:orotidine-5'-phosphate decarboxylase